MSNILNGLNKIRELNKSSIFEKGYATFIALVSALFWILGTLKVVPPYLGLTLIGIFASVSLLLFNDFKYLIPSVISFIFANPEGYKSDSLPIPMLIIGFSLIIVIIAFTIINRKRITFKNKDKSFYAFIYFALFSFLPLAYNNLITKEVITLIFVYFSYLLYLGVYLFFLANMNEESFRVTSYSIEMIAIILALECIAKVWILRSADASVSIFTYEYFMGWGLCNEAGIMICFALPFVFLRAKSFSKIYEFIIFAVELSFIIIGMLLTTSRGTYLFGAVSLVALTIYAFINHKHRWKFIISIIAVLAVDLLIIQLIIGIPRIIQEILDYVFRHGLDSNGRVELYDSAVKLWLDSPLTIVFGKGWVAERVMTQTYFGMQDAYLVYHSTFFETLACYGALGVYMMIFHFIEKYKQTKKLGLFGGGLIVIGYIAVDLYGMIDNSYNFYYFMIPLVIVMASLDAYRPETKLIEVNN